MKKTILILSSVLLFGCQTVLEDVAVPAAEVKAVVFHSPSNLRADQLNLTKSKPVLNSSQNGEFENIIDATIVLSGNGNEVGYLHSYPGYILNNRNYEFISGIEYTLNVITPQNGTLTSSVTMPDSITDYTLEVDSIDQEWQVQYNGRLSIPDNPNKEEYFRVEAFSAYNNQPQEMWVEGEYFSDENVLDGMINTRFTTYSWDSEDQKRPKVYLVISAITKDHYEYGKALYNYDPQNPFSEPSPLPNNIEGGLGLFTLSNSRVIDLK